MVLTAALPPVPVIDATGDSYANLYDRAIIRQLRLL